ncbi:MAG: winged helix-turn-helix domain-containing protein [archaeon]
MLDCVFVESKWKILSALCEKESSPIELSKKLKTTLANISTQLRLLEALGLVKKQKIPNTQKGKPRTIFSLAKEFSYVTLVKKNYCSKKLIKLDKIDDAIFSIYFLNDSALHYYLFKFFFMFEEVLKECESLSYLGINGNDIELVVISSKKEELINKFANVAYTYNGNTRKIITFVYTIDDIKQGLNNKEAFFTGVVARSFTLYDKNNVILPLKEILNGS